MELGTILIHISITIAIGSTGFTIFYLLFKNEIYYRMAKWFSIFCSISITIIYLLLVYYFVVSDLNVKYVHSYSEKDYSLFYKWGGVLAGANGTLLFWVWLIALSLIIEELFQSWKDRKQRISNRNDVARTDEKALFVWVRFIVILIIIAFLYLILQVDIFQPTEPSALAAYPNGYGLHANLHTPLMIAHPPVEFAGYAFITIPMAAGLAYLIRGRGKWTNISLQWGRWSWFFYALGLGIGGLWAYIVLGWGGYWAWDPIETVNLIPMITLTAFVHGQLYNHHRKILRNVSILLAILTFILSLLATFVTRSGLWVSVHDFAEIVEKEAGSRLIKTMETIDSAYFFITFMVVMLIVTAILFTWYLMKQHIKIGKNKRRLLPFIPTAYIALLSILLIFVLYDPIDFVSTAMDVSSLVTFGDTYLGAIIILVMLIIIPIFWFFYNSEHKLKISQDKNEFLWFINEKYLMLATIFMLLLGVTIIINYLFLGVNGIQREIFDSKAPMIILPLVVLLAVCMIWRSVGKKVTVLLIFIMIISSVFGYFLFDQNHVVGISYPILFIALISSFYKIYTEMFHGLRDLSWRLKLASILLMISGVMGLIMWAASPSQINLLYFHIKPTFELALIAFIFSSFVVIGSLFTAARIKFGFVILSGIFGMLVNGYNIGAILAAVATILIAYSYDEFRIAKNNINSNRIIPRLKINLRLVWTHIIHFALILFLIGVVQSTYLVLDTSSDPELENEFLDMEIGETLNFAGYELKFVGSEGIVLEERQGFEKVIVNIEIYKNGRLMSIASPFMKWAEHMGHYHQFVYVENVVIKDFYIIVLGFYTPNQGWITSMGVPGVRFLSDDILTVALEIKSIPGMSALWSGFWIMSIGICYIITIDYFKKDEKIPVVNKIFENEIKKTDQDEYYDLLLEKELMRMNNKKKEKKS